MFTAMKRNRNLQLTSLAQLITPLVQGDTEQICHASVALDAGILTTPTYQIKQAIWRLKTNTETNCELSHPQKTRNWLC